jgi:hypothetical protein
MKLDRANGSGGRALTGELRVCATYDLDSEDEITMTNRAVNAG